MVDAVVANPAGAFGLTASTNTQNICDFVNGPSGATRTAGDLVITDVNGVNATTTTTANAYNLVGVVAGNNRNVADATTYAAGANMPVVRGGVARINIASNTVTALDLLTSSTTAGVAQTNTATTVATAVGTIIGVALEASSAKDANNCIRCYVSPR